MAVSFTDSNKGSSLVVVPSVTNGKTTEWPAILRFFSVNSMVEAAESKLSEMKNGKN